MATFIIKIKSCVIANYQFFRTMKYVTKSTNSMYSLAKKEVSISNHDSTQISTMACKLRPSNTSSSSPPTSGAPQQKKLLK